MSYLIFQWQVILRVSITRSNLYVMHFSDRNITKLAMDESQLKEVMLVIWFEKKIRHFSSNISCCNLVVSNYNCPNSKYRVNILFLDICQEILAF